MSHMKYTTVKPHRNTTIEVTWIWYSKFSKYTYRMHLHYFRYCTKLTSLFACLLFFQMIKNCNVLPVSSHFFSTKIKYKQNFVEKMCKNCLEGNWELSMTLLKKLLISGEIFLAFETLFSKTRTFSM